MKISIFQKLLFFSFIILACNGLIGYAVYQSNDKLLDSKSWVKHTEKIITLSGKILSLSKDIEIASRDFVLTNDRKVLEPLKKTKTIFVYFEQLRHLTLDNPVQQKRLDSLMVYLNTYLEFSLQTVALRSEHGLIPAIDQISSKQGKHYTDRIRQIISDIQQTEYELLEQRNQVNIHSVTTFKRFIVFMFAIMGLFTVVLLIVTGNYLFQHKEKEKKSAELIIINKELDIQHDEKVQQEAANKELEAFSYSVSHDLRAPLRHIGGFVDLLIKNNSSQLDEKGLRYLNIVAESSHEMGNLIDALLTFSRLSRTEIQHTKLDMKSMVDHNLKKFSADLAGKDVEINVSDLPDSRGDETLINQVWINLISNALKYSRNREKAIIEIGGKQDQGSIVFHVRDNGAGFDMQYAHKLFGVFQRLHKARDFEGIGIGLANVNRIVARHGGKCWAEGEVDHGAVFYFSLPND